MKSSHGAAASRAAPPESGHPVGTILVVGGSEVCVDLRENLADRYLVIESRESGEALAQSRSRPPDLVIADVTAAESDGYSLCRAVKADPALEFVPVLLLTPKQSQEVRYRGFSAGADDCVAAPFDIREFRARVDNLIVLRRRMRERLQPLQVWTGEDQEDASFLHRVEGVIEDHLDEEEFDVPALARYVANGRAQLYRRLQRITRVSPAKLIMVHRLNRAAALLLGSERSVTEIAYEVGFKSGAHFSRAFRSQFGVAPAAYHKQQAVQRRA